MCNRLCLNPVIDKKNDIYSPILFTLSFFTLSCSYKLKYNKTNNNIIGIENMRTVYRRQKYYVRIEIASVNSLLSDIIAVPLL
jgi:hypothetical protein